MHTVTRKLAVVSAALVVVLASACDQPGATSPDANPQFKVDPPGVGETTLCKVGSAADFTVAVKADTAATATTTNVHLTDGQCLLVAADHRTGGFTDVTITETVAPNMVLDSILNDSITVRSGVYVRKIVKGTNTVTGRIVGGDIGFIYTFRNRLITPSLQITKTADAASVNAGSNIGFTVTVTNSGPGTANGVLLSDALPTGTGITWSESPDNPNCTLVANALSCNFGNLASGASATVHVTSPTTVSSCGVYNNTASFTSTNGGTGQASATTTVVCPPPTGNEGCTPGYWKQSQHFDSWVNYTPSQLISSVFNTSPFPSLGSKTLLEGLSFHGGDSLAEAAQILLRAAIAALLNSTSVNYPLSTAQIISDVNAALASGSRDTILNLASDLDSKNNGVCPLN